MYDSADISYIRENLFGECESPELNIQNQENEDLEEENLLKNLSSLDGKELAAKNNHNQIPNKDITVDDFLEPMNASEKLSSATSNTYISEGVMASDFFLCKKDLILKSFSQNKEKGLFHLFFPKDF